MLLGPTPSARHPRSPAAAPVTQVDNYARVADSIVGWSSKLGPWSRLENHAVVGEDVTMRPEVRAELRARIGC